MADSIQALTLYDRISDPLTAIEKIGGMIARSGMFGCEKIEAGSVIAMTCLCDRISPLDFQRTYHLIGNRPSKRADAIVADFRTRKGGKLKIIERTAEAAEVELSLEGETQRFRMTWEEAQQEPFVWGKPENGKKVLKDKYATPHSRKQMLWYRVISDGIHTMAPEIVAGIALTELAEDDTPPATIKLATATVVDTTPEPAPVVKPQPPTTPAVPQVTKVIDAEVVTEKKPEPAPKKVAPAPASEPPMKQATATVTEPAAEFTPEVDPTTQKLTKSTVAKILAIFGDKGDRCFAYLWKVGWLKQDQDVSDLKLSQAKMIINRSEAFLKKVEAETLAQS